MTAKKGSTFERNFSRRLSMWWTAGDHDDWFWRSHGSGGRATQRSRRGQQTTGYAGDITATHSDAYPLLDFMSFELKCGYKNVHVADVIEAGTHNRPKWLSFWEQAEESAEQNRSIGWCLVTQRTQWQAMMWLSKSIARLLMKYRGIDWPVSFESVFDIGPVYGCQAEWWFDVVEPVDVLECLNVASNLER